MKDDNNSSTEVSSDDESNESERKKTISIVELDKFMPRRSSFTSSDFRNRRRSLVSDKTTFSKAYSYKCDLSDAAVASALRCPSSSSLDSSLSFPSINEGVRSMSLSFFEEEEVLDHIEASLFGEILTEAADRLVILRRTIDGKTSSPRTPGRILAREKGGCEARQERWMFFPEDAEHESVIIGVEQKLLRDWTLIYNVFRKVACELQNEETFNWLRTEVNAIIDSREKEFNLEANLKTWLDLIKRSEELLKSRQEEFDQDKKSLTEEIERLEAEIDRSYCDNNDKLDYVRRWEASKLEQQNLRQSVQEQSILDEIKEIEKAKKANAKVSEEFQNYLKFAINNQEAEITTWSYRYNEEIDRREEEIKHLEETIVEAQQFLEESRAVQSQRQVVIDEYLEEKRKIQAEIDYWDDVNQAATLIQANWKGYMVRHKLGPYKDLGKKQKKKKKPSKKSGKAKKKNK